MFLSNLLGLPAQLEVLLVIIVGLIGLVFDSSFFKLSRNLEAVWNVSLDPYKFRPQDQLTLKYVLAFIILFRSITLHIFIGTYVLMLWPALFCDHENLLEPWLLLAFFRNILTGLCSLVIGLWISLTYGWFNFLWIEFLIYEFLEHGPIFYSFITILEFYGILHHLIDYKDAPSKSFVRPRSGSTKSYQRHSSGFRSWDMEEDQSITPTSSVYQNKTEVSGTFYESVASTSKMIPSNSHVDKS